MYLVHSYKRSFSDNVAVKSKFKYKSTSCLTSPQHHPAAAAGSLCKTLSPMYPVTVSQFIYMSAHAAFTKNVQVKASHKLNSQFTYNKQVQHSSTTWLPSAYIWIMLAKSESRRFCINLFFICNHNCTLRNKTILKNVLVAMAVLSRLHLVDI